MENTDKTGFPDVYRRDFTPAQWDHFMQRAEQRAHDARARAFRDAARALGRLLLRGWHAYRLWRERRRAMAQLAALDGHMLKDMGIDRSEIEAAVRGRDAEDTAQRQLAA